MLAGWIKWVDDRPDEQIMVRVADGKKLPKRNELGDNDPEWWPKDSEGKARDPWQFTN